MGKGPSGSGLAECAAWPVIVVMVRALLQHGRGVSLVDDQQGVEEFPAEGAEEAFGDRVARGALDRASTAGSASPMGSSGHAAPDPMVLGRARRGPGDHDGPGHPSGGCPRIDTTEICTCGVSGAVSGDDESREHDMATPSRRTDPSLQDLPRELLAVAAVLIGVGSALGLAGLAMGAAALATAGRRWYNRADLSPGELARLKWEQAKAVAGASSGAWRETELAKYSPRSGRPT